MKIDLLDDTSLPAAVISDVRVGSFVDPSAYQEAYITAYYALEAASNNDDELTRFYNNLKAANEAVKQLEVGAYYVLRNAYTGYCNNAVSYANVNDHKVYWHAQVADVETPYTVDLNNGSDNKEASDTYWKQ